MDAVTPPWRYDEGALAALPSGEAPAESVTNMGMANKKLPAKFQDWIEVRQRHRLSHAHVQMARELGMNPRKLGKLANHDQEPWKAPLPQFIERLYFRSFGRERPETVTSIEERAALQQARKAARKEAKRAAQVRSSGESNERVPILRVPSDRPSADRAGEG
jgi:hypothetical protein